MRTITTTAGTRVDLDGDALEASREPFGTRAMSKCPSVSRLP